MSASQSRPDTPALARGFVRFGQGLTYVLERLAALMMAIMVGIVWYGVIDRYYIQSTGAWTEEASRYIMIWAVFLVIPVCAYYREHIGLTMILGRFPPDVQKRIIFVLDLVGIGFFLVLFVYGLKMTIEDGPTNYSTLFGMRMTIPYASVPVSAGLTLFMILVTIVRDIAGVTTDLKQEEPLS